MNDLKSPCKLFETITGKTIDNFNDDATLAEFFDKVIILFISIFFIIIKIEFLYSIIRWCTMRKVAKNTMKK